MKQVALGIDIGGTNTAIGVVDREGNLIYEKKPQLPTPQKSENPTGSEIK
jgi:glucokinase